MKSIRQTLWHQAARVTFVFVCVVPFMPGQSANAGVIVDGAKAYADELILLACIICWFAGSWLGAVYPDDDGVKPLSHQVKALSSFLMGLCAFIYVLHVDKALTLINPLWVGGVAFVAPVVIGLIRQWAYMTVKSKTGLGGDTK
jgi:hypothetical protein